MNQRYCNNCLHWSPKELGDDGYGYGYCWSRRSVGPVPMTRIAFDGHTCVKYKDNRKKTRKRSLTLISVGGRI